MNDDAQGGVTQDMSSGAQPNDGGVTQQTDTPGYETLLDGGESQGASLKGLSPNGPSQQAPQQRPSGAPEQYEAFTLPEGLDPDRDDVKAGLDEASGLFRELGLNQTQAQKLIDAHFKHWMGGAVEMEEALEKQMQRQVDEWARQIKGDPEFGGIHLDESLRYVRRGISELGGAALEKALKETGVINHPAIFAAFVRVGKMYTEDHFVSGAAAQAAADNSPSAVAHRIYPNM